MKLIFRVAIIHTKRERTAPYSPLLFLHNIHSLKTCVASWLHTDVQAENIQTCKSAFACAITSVSSQIWQTLSWAHPRQVDVHLCTLLYRTVWSKIVQDFYFKPTLSERKHKCSGNGDATTILFLKVCLVAQLCLNFQYMDCSIPGSSCHWDSPDKNTEVGCHALSRYTRFKMFLLLFVFVFYVLLVWKVS